MAKLKLQMQISIDAIDPVGQDDHGAWDEMERHSRDLLDTADTIVLGRKTASDFIPYWDDAASAARASEPWHAVARRISSARKIVFSKTTREHSWGNTEINGGDLATEIHRLKATNKMDILVYGGVSFVSALIKERLVDELHLFVNPVAMGKEKSIFSGLGAAQQLRLVKCIPYSSGVVLLNYECK